LWELDNLYRTLYILTYIDEVELRQSVQKALNRGEAYHRFRRAISYVIDPLVARYDDPDFWNRALIEAPDDSWA
jgi:hypothetical protein